MIEQHERALMSAIDAVVKQRAALADKIDKLTGERNALARGVDQWRVGFHELRIERDALKAAARLALCALERSHADAYLDQPAIAALKAVL